MKFDASDVLNILRLFAVAQDNNSPRQIERIQKTKPAERSVAIYFIFLKRNYVIFIDNDAEDDENYILSSIERAGEDHNYTLIENPNDVITTFGMPFKGKDVYVLVDQPSDVRLDVALVERFGTESRSTYQKLIERGQVTVNGKIETSSKYKVEPHDVITIAAQETTIVKPQIDLIYEDDHVLVINKPLGMLTHAKGVLIEEFTASDFVKDKTTYKADTNRPGIVHRLDRATSGVLLMAKTEEAAQLISRQFSDRKTKKTYSAVVTGQPKQPTALIDLPIGRNPSAPSTFRIDASGKPAQTIYEVVKTDTVHSLMQLRPRTGRTHQLRVHMQYIGTPIVGDRVYGTEEGERMYLHAESLEVTLPGGIRKTFTAPIPDEFTTMIKD